MDQSLALIDWIFQRVILKLINTRGRMKRIHPEYIIYGSLIIIITLLLKLVFTTHFDNNICVSEKTGWFGTSTFYEDKAVLQMCSCKGWHLTCKVTNVLNLR